MDKNQPATFSSELNQNQYLLTRTHFRGVHVTVHVLALRFDWFTGFFMSFVIGLSDNYGSKFGFYETSLSRVSCWVLKLRKRFSLGTLLNRWWNERVKWGSGVWNASILWRAVVRGRAVSANNDVTWMLSCSLCCIFNVPLFLLKHILVMHIVQVSRCSRVSLITVWQYPVLFLTKSWK